MRGADAVWRGRGLKDFHFRLRSLAIEGLLKETSKGY